MTIDVMIPVYQPEEELRDLLSRLKNQTVPVRKILLVNTEEQYWREELIKGLDGIEVIHIRKEEFNHGNTRCKVSERTDAEYFVWMTQDALPADNHLIKALLRPFENKGVVASYARQLPRADCGIIEAYTRHFNYPETSRIQSKEDENEMGIKAYFLSDVCAMYRKSAYQQVGGFKPAIFNEDMIFAIEALNKGFSVAYCADAKVYHSHDYSSGQLFRRNFDLGVSQRHYSMLFQGIRAESEGISLVKQTASYLIHQGKGYLIGKLLLNSGAKFFGYRMGKAYRYLPKGIVKLCTMDKEYWQSHKEK